MTDDTYERRVWAGDEQKQDELRKLERFDQDQYVSDMKAVMDTPQGRRLVWVLLSKANVFQSVVTENPHQMAIEEGARNNGLELLDDVITYAPQAFLSMQAEAIANDKRRKERERARRKAGLEEAS